MGFLNIKVVFGIKQAMTIFNFLPVLTALSAKFDNEVGALVRTVAPALRAFPVALNAVNGT